MLLNDYGFFQIEQIRSEYAAIVSSFLSLHVVLSTMHLGMASKSLIF